MTFYFLFRCWWNQICSQLRLPQLLRRLHSQNWQNGTVRDDRNFLRLLHPIQLQTSQRFSVCFERGKSSKLLCLVCVIVNMKPFQIGMPLLSIISKAWMLLKGKLYWEICLRCPHFYCLDPILKFPNIFYLSQLLNLKNWQCLTFFVWFQAVDPKLEEIANRSGGYGGGGNRGRWGSGGYGGGGFKGRENNGAPRQHMRFNGGGFKGNGYTKSKNSFSKPFSSFLT